jgi:dihydroneopterin aldolase
VDTIHINGIEIMGVHGVLPEEQQRAQPFAVDITLVVDLTAAAASDDLADTVDYGAVAEAVAAVVAQERFQLLERLAGRIADECRTDPRVQGVTVSLRKLRPPVPIVLDSVGVTVTR